MPKELIHFTVAERTAARLIGTRFGPCLASSQAGLLLGAVFHDALFYAVSPGAKPLESLAHVMHGADGQDTFALIRAQAGHAAQAENRKLPAALLAGMVSHLFADAAMHPMVYHFSGDYYANGENARSLARQRHRAMESLMDMAACPEKIGTPDYRLSALLRRCPDLFREGLPMQTLTEWASLPVQETQKQLSRAWRVFALLQRFYPMSLPARLLFALRHRLPRVLAETGMLFYAPQLKRQLPRLEASISYLHPVTGERLHASLDTLMDQAAAKAAALCHAMEPAVFEGAPLSLPEAGPSMDAGLSNTSTEAMLYFAEPPFPDLE
ncbi:hypothetical protein GM415_12010 [Pseudodesulfovibrio cashew]|uniref:Phospholipase C/D domain-containing protein n=1 Tax=Pseudodesulfovibrio cashew TaxID=2678688 RepID=A0A6I6JIN3_9BACT|nr:zinc dependent phospholipase C family protein [Pseudodesulfovibrio cashew]QGY40818.1 hypothetical protein GM415_12010 [Pseudodesulfovibrio cashew]